MNNRSRVTIANCTSHSARISRTSSYTSPHASLFTSPCPLASPPLRQTRRLPLARQSSTTSSSPSLNATKHSSPSPTLSSGRSKFSNTASNATRPSDANHQLATYSNEGDLTADHFPAWEDLAELAKGEAGGIFGVPKEVNWEEDDGFHGETFISDQDEGTRDEALPQWQERKLKSEVKEPLRIAKAPPSESHEASGPTLSPLPTLVNPRSRISTETTLNLDSPIQPYRPVLSVYRSPSDLLQPHERPVLSRFDWRLSAPVPLNPRGSPPSYYRKTDLVKQGSNRLVGVGLDAAREAFRREATEDEPWGWKVPVPPNQKGTWPSCDAYRTRYLFLHF